MKKPATSAGCLDHIAASFGSRTLSVIPVFPEHQEKRITRVPGSQGHLHPSFPTHHKCTSLLCTHLERTSKIPKSRHVLPNHTFLPVSISLVWHHCSSWFPVLTLACLCTPCGCLHMHLWMHLSMDSWLCMSIPDRQMLGCESSLPMHASFHMHQSSS